MQYKLLKPMISSGEIIGYEILDSAKQIRKVKKADVISLAEKGLVDAKVAVDSTGTKHISPSHKLDTTEDAEIYTVEARILKDNKLIGYKCKTSSGLYVKMTPVKLWEFAVVNQVTNVDAKIYNNILTLIGSTTKLEELPVLKT